MQEGTAVLLEDHLLAVLVAQDGVDAVQRHIEQNDDYLEEVGEYLQAFKDEVSRYYESCHVHKYLLFPVLGSLPEAFAGHGAVDGPRAIEDLELVTQRHMLHILDLSNGNRAEAARRLGVSRKTVDRKLAAWAAEGLDIEAF